MSRRLLPLLLICLMLPCSVLAQSNVALAGNPLTEYPWFEYIKAFNADAPVSIAVDPGLHPEIVGVTTKIWLVESGTATGWLQDHSLGCSFGWPRIPSTALPRAGLTTLTGASFSIGMMPTNGTSGKLSIGCRISAVTVFYLYVGTLASLLSAGQYDHIKNPGGETEFPDSPTPATGCDVSGSAATTARIRHAVDGSYFLVVTSDGGTCEGPYGGRSDGKDRHDSSVDPRPEDLFCP